MDVIIKFLEEYKKTIATAIVGALLYFGKSYLPDLFTSEFAESLEIPAGIIILFLLGRFTRMKTSDVELLEEVKGEDEKNQI